MSSKKLFNISALLLLTVMSLQRTTAKKPQQPISAQRKLAAADPRDDLDSGSDFQGQDRHLVWDCSDLPCDYPSGIYPILEGNGCTQVMAYCDFSDSSSTGWTVIQRRQEAPGQQLDFNRSYDTYRYGFGALDAEFWWGLEHVWSLTSRLDRVYELRVDLADFSGASKFALYGQFSVASHADGFRLSIAGYSGDAGDGFTYHSGRKFSAIDIDSDACTCDCADYYTAGWWYSDCYESNLNGVYLGNNNPAATQKGVTWGPWLGFFYSLKSAQIKIRPV